MSEDRKRESLTDETDTAIEESRMVLPGMQALFGFQLIATFNDRFDRLSEVLRFLHLVSLVLVAVAVALVMAPAAFHRIAERGWVSRYLINLTSNFLSAGMLALSTALALEVGIVSAMVLRSGLWGICIGCGLAAIFVLSWFILPLRRRHRRSSAPSSSAR